MEKHEIVIAGAGPGGLNAAKILAENGKDILVLDKLPEERIGEKVCNGALTTKAIHLGVVPKSLFELELKEVYLCPPSGNSVVIRGKEPLLGMLKRHEVGQWQLKEAEKAGAQLMDNSEVIDVDREKNELIIKDKERIKYEYLIGADGDESVVSKSLGTRSDTLTRGAEIKFDGYEGNALEVFLNYEKLGWGYMWILPYDHGSASLGAGTASKYPSSKRLVENAKEIMLKEKGVDLSKHKPSFRNLKATYGGFRHGNIFLVGDAATFISALWGEGIYPALKSGEIAAKAIINKDYNYKIDVNALYKFHRRGSVFISAINFIPTSFMGKATRVGFKFLPIFLKFDFAKRFIRTFLAKVR